MPELGLFLGRGSGPLREFNPHPSHRSARARFQGRCPLAAAAKAADVAALLEFSLSSRHIDAVDAVGGRRAAQGLRHPSPRRPLASFEAGSPNIRARKCDSAQRRKGGGPATASPAKLRENHPALADCIDQVLLRSARRTQTRRSDRWHPICPRSRTVSATPTGALAEAPLHSERRRTVPIARRS